MALRRAATMHSERLSQEPPEKARSCGKRTAAGTAIGAGVGAAVAAGLLGATGGSDSTLGILFKFTGAGAIGGLAIASAGCHN